MRRVIDITDMLRIAVRLVQHTVDDQIARVLDALRASGDEKWHNAYEESIHIPFVVAGPLINGGAREVDIPTNHADRSRR